MTYKHCLVDLSPGLTYFFRIIFFSTFLSLVVYEIEIAVLRRFDLLVPHGVIILGAFGAPSAYLCLDSIGRDLINWSKSRKNGAVMATRIHDSWPGGLGIIAASVRSLKFGYPADNFLDWCNQYGKTFSYKIFSDLKVFTVEPEYVKNILATQFELFDKGKCMEHQFYSLLGTGVFNSDGDLWKFHRTMTRPFFMRDRIIHFDIFDRHAKDALKLAECRLANGYPVNFQDLVSRFTLDSATEFLFGLDVRSLSAKLPYPPYNFDYLSAPEMHPSDRFVNAFALGMKGTSMRLRYGSAWPITELWRDQVKVQRKIMDEFVEPILAEAKARKEGRINKGWGKDSKQDDEQDTLLDHLLEKTQDLQVVKDELVNLLAAGRDGIAATLTFGVYMLTQYPSITTRLRDEILDVVGSEEQPTYDQIKDMKYLRAFINETLRLYPPVPLNSRTSKKGVLWMSKLPGQRPIYIPPNTECTYSVFLMHRREDLWGPDASQFDPNRFIDGRLQKYLMPNPYIFLPFNAGPRICLGQQFAYNEISFFLIRLLQRFSAFILDQPTELCPPEEWKACPGTKGTDKILLALHLTMSVKGGLWVKMIPTSDGK